MEHGSGLKRLFIIGGESIYREALAGATCSELFVTRVQGSFQCDRFFPEFESSFRLKEELGEGEDNGHAYRWERWERR